MLTNETNVSSDRPLRTVLSRQNSTKEIKPDIKVIKRSASRQMMGPNVNQSISHPRKGSFVKEATSQVKSF